MLVSDSTRRNEQKKILTESPNNVWAPVMHSVAWIQPLWVLSDMVVGADGVPSGGGGRATKKRESSTIVVECRVPTYHFRKLPANLHHGYGFGMGQGMSTLTLTPLTRTHNLCGLANPWYSLDVSLKKKLGQREKNVSLESAQRRRGGFKFSIVECSERCICKGSWSLATSHRIVGAFLCNG